MESYFATGEYDSILINISFFLLDLAGRRLFLSPLLPSVLQSCSSLSPTHGGCSASCFSLLERHRFPFIFPHLCWVRCCYPFLIHFWSTNNSYLVTCLSGYPWPFSLSLSLCSLLCRNRAAQQDHESGLHSSGCFSFLLHWLHDLTLDRI